MRTGGEVENENDLSEHQRVTPSFDRFKLHALRLFVIFRSLFHPRLQGTQKVGVGIDLENSKLSSSQGELLLHAPQGLGTLHQLLLLFRLQGHVDDICQAAVSQNTGDAQEDLVVHTVHALSHRRRRRGRAVRGRSHFVRQCMLASFSPTWTSVETG